MDLNDLPLPPSALDTCADIEQQERSWLRIAMIIYSLLALAMTTFVVVVMYRK